MTEVVVVAAAWVVTFYVNLVFWRVLQCKRIGFLWRSLHLLKSFSPFADFFTPSALLLLG